MNDFDMVEENGDTRSRYVVVIDGHVEDRIQVEVRRKYRMLCGGDMLSLRELILNKSDWPSIAHMVNSEHHRAELGNSFAGQQWAEQGKPEWKRKRRENKRGINSVWITVEIVRGATTYRHTATKCLRRDGMCRYCAHMTSTDD